MHASQTEPAIPLGRIAQALAAELHGDPALPISRLVHPTLAEGPGDLAIATEPAALEALSGCKAGAALVANGRPHPAGVALSVLVVERPRYALAKLLQLFERPLTVTPGIHPSAVVEPSAELGAEVSI